MDLREQIGQRLVTGFPGSELTEDFRRMVREYKISNVILFRENITAVSYTHLTLPTIA